MPVAKISLVFLITFALFSGVLINRATKWFVDDRHFSSLAQSFINNDLFLNPVNLPPGDYADYYGKQYVFFGPIPSVILIPFVSVLGRDFPQNLLAFISIPITFILIYKICRKLLFDKWDSLWLATFFVFGTVYYFVSLVNISAYLVQAVAIPFVIYSLYEYFTKKRWLIIGIAVAFAIATRISLIGLCVFYILEILRTNKQFLPKTITLFLIPVIMCLSLLGLYNYRRFNNFLDTGYTRNVSVLDKNYDNHILGFFSPIHVPGNLYAMLIMGPEPLKKDVVNFVLHFPYIKANHVGLAIWYTSPLFLYLFSIKHKPYNINALISIITLAIPSLFYFGIGTSQYGYRYSLDFIPLLFLILLSAFSHKLTNFAKFIIFLGAIFNLLFMLSIWDLYPHFNFWEYIPKFYKIIF